MTTFSSTELLTKLKPVLTALGKTQAKKCTLSLSVNTTGTTAIVAGEWGKLSFHTADSSDVAFARSYVLSDVEGILSLDKSRFDLDLDAETLNDFPLFTAEPTLIEAGEVVQTAELDDIGPLANKPVLPEISKLLKKSLIRESEYLLWRITPDNLQLCQVYPTNWGVRYELSGDYGVSICAYTNKLENKLLAKLLNGRFKVSKTRYGYLFESSTYSVFVTAREDLTADLYPPFNTDQKGA